MTGETLDLSGHLLPLLGKEINLTRVVGIECGAFAVRIRPQGRPFIEHLPSPETKA